MSVVETTEHDEAAVAPATDAASQADLDDVDDVEEALVEEISIDGMCGVY